MAIFRSNEPCDARLFTRQISQLFNWLKGFETMMRALKKAISNNPSMKFCDEEFVKSTLKKYKISDEIYPEFSYATVRDFCDSWDHLRPLSRHGDLKNVQRPWALKTILSHIPIGGKLLEFGGGQPLIAATLARMGYDVTIVDPYDGTGNGPTEYEQYISEYPEVRLIKGYFHPGMAELLGEEGSFDCVYSISVIEHIPLPMMTDVFSAMQMYVKSTGYSLHAIDFVYKGCSSDEHMEMLRELAKLSGISEDMIHQTLLHMDEDVETYYLSAEAHNAWRMGLTYDEFPMRICVSLQLCTPLSKITHNVKNRKYCGGIEIICNEYVNGYCFDTNFPDEPVYLRILSEGLEIGRTRANLKSPQFVNLGIGNGQCGFHYPFTKKKIGLNTSKISVVPVGDCCPLKFIHTIKNKEKRKGDLYGPLTEETLKRTTQFKNLFIVNHIPKTAGTSLRRSFEKKFRENQCLYHYFSIGACSPEIWNWKFAEEPKLKFENVVNTIMDRPISLVMGHFGFPELHGFDKLIKTFPLAKSIVFLRDPRNHICSLYLFAKKFFSEHSSFEEYIEKPYTQNYQTNALCGVPVSQIGFVGIVEAYNKSLEKINEKFGLKLDEIRMNVNQGNSEGSHDYSKFGEKKVWARFEELNQADIKVYQQVKSRFKTDSYPNQYSLNSVQPEKSPEVHDFTWAKTLNKIDWAKALSTGRGPGGEYLPPCPSNDIQKKYVGSSGHDAFLEALTFIDKMKENLSENGLKINAGIKILDCGVGFGRLYRAMLREVDPTSILGVDIDSKAIDMCRKAMPFGNFELIGKNPPYENLKSESFDLIYLYSVFSHLSEAGFKSMMTEFRRILKKGAF
jgi:2-polyprenyl-3-methyl-5-hydroxy-6-metoxy-1,4-benzoquinol methylase